MKDFINEKMLICSKRFVYFRPTLPPAKNCRLQKIHQNNCFSITSSLPLVPSPLETNPFVITMREQCLPNDP